MQYTHGYEPVDDMPQPRVAKCDHLAKAKTVVRRLGGEISDVDFQDANTVTISLSKPVRMRSIHAGTGLADSPLSAMRSA